MTYMNQNVDFAVSGGIQELGLGELEMVSGGLTVEEIEMMGYFLGVSATKFVTNPVAGVKSFYYDFKWFVTKL